MKIETSHGDSTRLINQASKPERNIEQRHYFMAANEDLHTEINKLKDDITKLRGDVGDLLQVLREAGIDKFAQSRESFDEELQKGREKVRATMDKARVSGEKALDDLEEGVSEHPLSSLLMAFGLGFIVAKVLGGGHD
jgi:ElaB/YqjD/DUF883 family membrane-anchored ribosome-binding protein